MLTTELQNPRCGRRWQLVYLPSSVKFLLDFSIFLPRWVSFFEQKIYLHDHFIAAASTPNNIDTSNWLRWSLMDPSALNKCFVWIFCVRVQTSVRETCLGWRSRLLWVRHASLGHEDRAARCHHTSVLWVFYGVFYVTATSVTMTPPQGIEADHAWRGAGGA